MSFLRFGSNIGFIQLHSVRDKKEAISFSYPVCQPIFTAAKKRMNGMLNAVLKRSLSVYDQNRKINPLRIAWNLKMNRLTLKGRLKNAS